jgi:2-oxoglutarate ferredoxin oxidoreductase subunit alpha
MTPGTGVLTYLAQVADEYGKVFEQAEDELAAINMVCGAVYAGVPALTSTSGGGFSLMCEGLSLAGMMELPAFIVLAQRPGPATGLPTRTAQEDLGFAINAGHGEFPRAVYAPGSQEQCFEVIRRGLEIAHKYQSPAILLADQFLMDSRRNVPEFDRTLAPIDRHVVDAPGEDYVRYAMAENGVSPRAVPGGDVFVVCDSDEHDEKGHITEDFDTRIRQHEKRLRKQDGLSREMIPPVRYGADDADAVMLCWGSTYMPCREAVDALRESGEPVAMVHFAQVWPLSDEIVSDALQGIADDTRVISLELNATGQFASILRERGFLSDVELMLRYDGCPFSAEEIVERFQQ